MRTSGLVDDPACPAVHDHLAWTGRGEAGLARVAHHVFGQAAPTERLVLLSSDGSPCGLETDYAADLESGRLVTMSAIETYAPVLDGVPDAATTQLLTFDVFVDDALDAGYSALRVVADNTAMLSGTDAQARNWLAWEQLTDRWQAQRPVNGNCFFDDEQVAPDRLRTALVRHPVVVGREVPWRLFYEQDDAGTMRLALSGSVEAFDAVELSTAIATSLDLGVVADGPLELTLGQTEYLHHQIAYAISGLTARNPGLRVVDVPVTVSRLLGHLPSLPGFDV